MGILDKLRPQSRHTHPDPAIRLEAVHDTDLADQATLVAMAKDDVDSRVRRAAIARLSDVAALADIARNESDEGVREHAVGQLADRASKHDPDQAGPAVEALVALGRERELGSIARTPGPEALRRQAVEALRDSRLLASVARHAADAGARMLAVGRLADPAELEGVALRGDHADAAVAAVDALPSPTADLLTAISQKAKTKAAQKRARALLRVGESAVRSEDTGPEYKEVEQLRARDLVTQMRALAAAGDIVAVREGYGAGRVAWVELLADADIRPEIVGEFESSSAVVRDRLAADDAARAEAEAARQARAREQAGRLEACQRVETLQGEAILDHLAEIRASWEGMPPMPEEWAVELQHRFDEACRAAENRHARLRAAREMADHLPQVVAEIETLAGTEDYAAVRGRWFALRKQWQTAARELMPDADLTARYEQAAAGIDAKEQVWRDSKGAEQTKNLQRLQAIVQGLETKAAAESLTLKSADGLLKDVKLAIGTMGPLPTKQDRDDLTVRLQAVRASLAPRIQELREAEEWKRWANVQVQEDLCTKMEALVTLADNEPEKAANEMKLLQERWKPVAAAPRSQASALWTRFKTAQDQVYEKCKDVFAQQAAERGDNLKRKTQLAERAEALKDSSDWVKTADAIKALQAEWKGIGPVTRGHERAIWERFRAACDAFFTRRQEDLKQRKHDWTENLRKKEALVAEAEQLAQSSEWEKAAARIKALQAEWKTIGPVKRSKSEAIWQRFRGACDLFFERFKNRDSVALQGKVADRETAVTELEALVPADDQPDAHMPDDLYARVQAARARWVQGPELPRHTLAPLADRVNEALLKLVTRWPGAFAGSDLDPAATRDRMQKLIAKVEKLLPAESAEPAKDLSPAELLARQWREALAANTMGAGAARQAEDARQRAAEQEVRSAQAAWNRLGPLAAEERRPLQDRFDRSVRKFFEIKRRSAARA
jgi:hypothetical protein